MSDAFISALTGLTAAVVGAGVVVSGWAVAHRQQAERDRANKQRDIRIQFLTQAWRALESVSNRPIGPREAPVLEAALADIQLLGTPKRCELVRDAVEEFVRNRSCSFDDVLRDLRRELRGELSAGDAGDKLKFFRMSFPDDPDWHEADDAVGSGRPGGSARTPAAQRIVAADAAAQGSSAGQSPRGPLRS